MVLIAGGLARAWTWPRSPASRTFATCSASARRGPVWCRRQGCGAETGTLERAVELAAELAEPGDTVLLAPGGASFDQFASYAERGDRFAALVRSITEEARSG